MAEGKKSFILYTDLITNIDHLTNEEKGTLFNHLLEYVNDMKPILTDRLILTAWKPIERQLKRDLIKFEEVKVKRSEAGKKSAELRALKKSQQSSTNPTSVKSVQQSSTNPTVSVNDNVNDIKQTNIVDEIFLKTVCKFFSQTTEPLERKVWGFMYHLKNKGGFNEFEKQTNAYIKYKKLSEEKIHRWSSFEREWSSEDWISLLTNKNNNIVKDPNIVSKPKTFERYG